MISINNNLSALNTARTLSGHYGRLQTSTERLSSGLRINGAADDAAGLAIRELMRADIAALNQGLRNANDAISMLQTFDGALGVIDEKLIRMKELAEQAATGTYDSTQRLMIDSEFQAMGSEINRIANATDFNGVKLLCTPMVTWHTKEDKFVPDPVTITAPQFTASPTTPPHTNTATLTKKITTANEDNLNKLINETTPTKTIKVVLTALQGQREEPGRLVPGEPTTLPSQEIQTEYNLAGSEFSIASVQSNNTISNPVFTYDGKNWTIVDDNHDNFIIQNQPDPTLLIAFGFNPMGGITFSMNETKRAPVDFTTFTEDHPDIAEIKIDTKNNTYKITRNYITLNPNDKNGEFNGGDYTAKYNDKTNTITVNLLNGSGGSVNINLANDYVVGDEISFDIKLAGEVKTVDVEHHTPDPDQKLIIHFGTMNDSAEDYYQINYENCTLEGLGLEGVDIKTQGNAQNALVDINGAIVQKDKVRAKFGAMQNRLENTATNLRIQSENLQNAESRISDTQIATEMMNFVRNQILTNSAVAMLAQANSMPQMVMALIRQ